MEVNHTEGDFLKKCSGINAIFNWFNLVVMHTYDTVTQNFPSS